MTAAGTRGTRGARSSRVLVAVVALYALVLQSVLGGAAAMPAPSPFDVICLTQADGAAPQPGHSQDHADHHACCTGAVFAATVEPPPATATLVAWPVRVSSRIGWRRDGAVSARAPPGIVASPRAPPVA